MPVFPPQITLDDLAAGVALKVRDTKPNNGMLPTAARW
jgi:hypothetical protein